MESTVFTHTIATVYNSSRLKDVGSYIQGPMDRVSIIELKECWRKFLHHNNIKTCWISDPKNSRVSMQTYKFNDQSYKWRGYCFLVGFPGQVPVNISESTERMLTGEWSGGLAGKYSPFQRQTYEIT